MSNPTENSSDSARETLTIAIYRLLRPLVRILLRYGMPFGSFMQIAKQVYVEIAEQDFKLPGKKQTDSRISVITGLTRKDVKLFRNRSVTEDGDTAARYNRAARVINGWIQDRSYLDGWNKPMILAVEGAGSTFTSLVRDYGGDIPVRAVLDELLRVGAVERLDDGRVRLLQNAYVPHTGEVDKLHILGKDTALLIKTFDHNLRFPDTEEHWFQRKVAYNNLPQEAVPILQNMVSNQGQKFLEEINSWLSNQDRDNNPHAKGSGRCHAGVGIYFFQEEYDDTSHE